jgi:hypothetical protein
MMLSRLIRRSATNQIKTQKRFIGYGLESLGLSGEPTIHRNLSYEDLAIHEKNNNEGNFVEAEYGNTFAVDTGKFTGRSPKDKWIVKQAPSEDNFWWGDVNQPMEPEVFDELYEKCVSHYNNLDEFYLFDGFCGANPNSRKRVRFLTELAWQQHFVRNMFIRPDAEELSAFSDPEYTIINACKVVDEDWQKHNLNSEVFVAFNTEKKVAIIGGTWYGGEMKKGIFSMMNYWLPLDGIMPMHCSANLGDDGSTALFFGLSGTFENSLFLSLTHLFLSLYSCSFNQPTPNQPQNTHHPSTSLKVREKQHSVLTRNVNLSGMTNTDGMMMEFSTLRVDAMPRQSISPRKRNLISTVPSSVMLCLRMLLLMTRTHQTTLMSPRPRTDVYLTLCSTSTIINQTVWVDIPIMSFS